MGVPSGGLDPGFSATRLLRGSAARGVISKGHPGAGWESGSGAGAVGGICSAPTRPASQGSADCGAKGTRRSQRPRLRPGPTPACASGQRPVLSGPGFRFALFPGHTSWVAHL